MFGSMPVAMHSLAIPRNAELQSLYFEQCGIVHFNGIHTVGITSVACVTPDCQSASSITPAYTSGMTIKLCSLRNIAALLVRLLILQRED